MRMVQLQYVCSECGNSVYNEISLYPHQLRFWPTHELKQCKNGCGKPTFHRRKVSA